MKIVEDSPTRLVMKQSALVGQLVGIILIIGGIGVEVAATTLKVHNTTILYIAGVVAIVVGILMILFTKSDTIVADKNTRQLIVNFKSLKNKKGQNQTCSFDDISSVQLFQQYREQFVNNRNMNNQNGLNIGIGGMGMGNMGHEQTDIQMSLAIQLKNGSIITVAKEERQAGLNLGISSNSLASKGQKLASALGVPFQESGAMNPGQVVQTIKQSVTSQAGSFVPGAPTVTNPALTPAPVNPQANVAPPPVVVVSTPTPAGEPRPPQVIQPTTNPQPYPPSNQDNPQS